MPNERPSRSLDQLRLIRDRIVAGERERVQPLLPPAPTAPGPGPVQPTDTPAVPPPPADAPPGTGALPVSPRVRHLLDRHCGAAGWRPEALVDAVLEGALATRSPRIRVGSRVVAEADSFRRIRNMPDADHLEILSEKGRFSLRPSEAHPRLHHWIRHYRLCGHPHDVARRAAIRRTLMDLRSDLEDVSDYRPGQWTKTLSEAEHLLESHDRP